uniref:Uncharacterized protein n=1 Tax=Avena sativa TaxID=4498 RepID=A0ACD5Z6T4_AVESA
MSSLTTISSGMEEPLERKELVDTRLSLSLVIGTSGGSPPPPPVEALLTAPPTQENQAARTRKGPQSGRFGSTATAGQHGKRARTVQSGSDGDGGDAANGSRKKLRLTGEQAALMEKSFRAHNVLSHGEKHDLARELGLNPRQVEVWFQNRRARTKLKQTELDCELLRRWCEQLSDDNARLRQELAIARSSSSSPFLSRLTAAATVNAACSSCNKPGVGLTNRD